VIPKRPINADVPAPEEKKSQEPEKAPPSAPQEKPAKPAPAQPRPLAPKLLAGLVVLALAFIVVAIVGSSGGDDDPGGDAGTVPRSADSGDGGEAPSPQVAEALAFPGFATNNTTRIGGPDPASNAAGVALAVFPSTTPSQRPAAVTVVDEDDPTGAIAAAVLMAPPVRAPILFTQDGALPEDSAEALEALAPTGSKDTDGVSVFTIGAIDRSDLADAGKVETVLGARPTQFGKAAAIARLREEVAGAPEHIVIAPEAEPEFAAPAAAWAARSGDPVLFVESRRLPPETAGMLQRHPQVPVYVLGPESVISDAVVKEIEKVSKRVKRVAGDDPVANALALARYGDGGFGWNVNDPGHGFVLARADSPAGAAGAAPLSASGTWGPLLLTDDAATLPRALRDYFLDVKPGYTDDPTRAFYNRVWVIGDGEAIDVVQQAEVNELAELVKIGGGG
jgi:ell wall binding domain 2 (CWB2)